MYNLLENYLFSSTLSSFFYNLGNLSQLEVEIRLYFALKLIIKTISSGKPLYYVIYIQIYIQLNAVIIIKHT